jgi:HK97 family phage portal protein
MTLSLALRGNAYAKIERDAKGVPSSLTPLRSDLVTPVREVGTVTYHYYSDGKEYIFAKESILHLKGFGDGIVGLSPLAYSRDILGVSKSADKFAAKSFQGSGRYRGFVSIDKLLTTEQRVALQAMYDTASVDDTRTWVFEAGAKFNQTSMSPDDMQMLQSREFQLGEIARIFRVPSYLINDTAKSTSWGSGIEQQNLGFLTYTLRPYLTRWESAINHTLLSRTDQRKYFVEHSVEGLLRADSQARAAFYGSAIQNGWMDRNEVRAKENLPPRDGAGELTAQVNMTPVAELPGVRNGNEAPAA